MTKPNLLLIVSDQQHPDFLGATGRYPIQTPALDRLCHEGTRYTRAYTPCPLCTPARASMLTGQYPSRHGAWSIGTSLREDCLSLPRLLREQAGYRTALIGKSHYQSCLAKGSFEAPPHSQDWDFFERWNGPWYGFDYVSIGHGHGFDPHSYSMHYGLWLRQHDIPLAPPYFNKPEEAPVLQRSQGHWELPQEAHSSAWVAHETIQYLDRHVAEYPDQPFFLSVNFPDPHPPFVVPAPWNSLYEDTPIPDPVRYVGEDEENTSLYRHTLNKKYPASWSNGIKPPCQLSINTSSVTLTEEERTCWRTSFGMVSLMDHYVGKILDELDRLNITQNTLVVFTSDHGDYMGHHWLWSKGGSHYRDAVSVPFLVRWPEHAAAGTTSDALQSLIDLPPTFMAAAGLEPAATMQGINQMGTWASHATNAREGVWIDHRVESGIEVHSWVTSRYRLSIHHILAENRTEIELYDLEEDPNELKNCAQERPHIVTRMLVELERYRCRIAGPWQARTAFA